MSRTTFYFVLSKIDHRIRKEFVVDAPMNPDQSLALCLYRLAVLRLSLHNRRDVWTSRISCMPKVVEVCTTIIKELWLETVEIHFPKTNDEFKEKLQDMDTEWQFSCAFAAIDGSHLPIKCPSLN